MFFKENFQRTLQFKLFKSSGLLLSDTVEEIGYLFRDIIGERTWSSRLGLVVRCWENYLTSMTLNLLIYEMGL